MKKLVLASVTALLALALLASCADKKATPNDTQNPTANAPVTTGQPVKEPESTAPQTTEVPTDTEVPAEKLTLNEDMLAYYGMTFDELEAKYGECIAYEYIMGGPAYAFKNAYGWYCFYGWPDFDAQNPSEWIYDEEGNKAFAKPEKSAKCYVLDMGSVRDLFNLSFNTLKISEIEAIEGIKLVGTYDPDGLNQFVYATQFSYDGFEYPETRITIFRDSEDSITPNSSVRIFLNRDYIKR